MKKWNFLSSNTPETIDEILNILQKNRDITPEEIRSRQIFKLNNLTPEDIGIDKLSIKKAVTRVKHAVETGEQIVIYGDYDADGVCATTILWEEIYSKTKNVMPYIPDRKSEGYGLSEVGINNLLEKYPDTKLIITVDNGITATKGVKYAQKKGIDVIITDHHTKDTKDPDAFAIIHTSQTSGTGVSWIFSRELSFAPDEINSKLDLVAIATIADMVPLTGINFQLVREGLLQLNKTKRVGLNALITQTGLENKNIGVYEVGFVIAPRLNATGRMTHAIDSLRLLCTKKAENAKVLSKKLDIQNRQRQIILDTSTKHAKEVARTQLKDKKIVIISKANFEEGVIGLIASRLKDEFYLPSIVISKGDKISKGSARSISGVDITKLLKKHRKYLESVGGHPMAAGFSLKTENIPAFEESIIKEAEKVVKEELRIRELKIDTTLRMRTVTEDLHRRLQDLCPFGVGNTEPIFVSTKLTIKKIDIMGKEKNHLKIVVEEENKRLESIGFGFAKDFSKSIDDQIDIAYTIDINEWRGTRKVVLKLKDYRDA